MDETPPPLSAALGERKSRWPLVFGILGILFGSLRILGAIASPMVTSFSISSQFENFEKAGVDIPAGLKDDYVSVMNHNAIGNGVIGLVLLIGGILLLKRRRVGAMVMQLWSVLKITIGGFLLYQTLGPTNAYTKLTMAASFGDASGSPEAQAISTGIDVAQKFGLALGFIWLSALPIILLVWLNRDVIKREIATWGNSNQAAS